MLLSRALQVLLFTSLATGAHAASPASQEKARPKAAAPSPSKPKPERKIRFTDASEIAMPDLSDLEVDLLEVGPPEKRMEVLRAEGIDCGVDMDSYLVSLTPNLCTVSVRPNSAFDWIYTRKFRRVGESNTYKQFDDMFGDQYSGTLEVVNPDLLKIINVPGVRAGQVGARSGWFGLKHGDLYGGQVSFTLCLKKKKDCAGQSEAYADPEEDLDALDQQRKSTYDPELAASLRARKTALLQEAQHRACERAKAKALEAAAEGKSGCKCVPLKSELVDVPVQSTNTALWCEWKVSGKCKDWEDWQLKAQ